MNAYSIAQLLLFDMIIYLCAAPAPSNPLSTNSYVIIWRRLIQVCFFSTAMDVTAVGICCAK